MLHEYYKNVMSMSCHFLFLNIFSEKTPRKIFQTNAKNLNDSSIDSLIDSLIHSSLEELHCCSTLRYFTGV